MTYWLYYAAMIGDESYQPFAGGPLAPWPRSRGYVFSCFARKGKVHRCRGICIPA